MTSQHRVLFATHIHQKFVALPLLLTFCLMTLPSDVGAADTSFLTNGLAARYLFDGNADDSGPTGNHGTVFGAAPTADRFALSNAAYYFDGIDDYIQIPDSAAFGLQNDSFTFGIWLRFGPQTNSWGRNAVLSTVNANTDPEHQHSKFSFQVYGSQGNVALLVDDVGFMSKASRLDDQQWRHFAIVCNGNHYWLYINGDLDNEAVLSHAENFSDAPLVVGLDYFEDFSSGYVYQGAMDDLRIYNRALSAAEIFVLYKRDSFEDVHSEHAPKGP